MEISRVHLFLWVFFYLSLKLFKNSWTKQNCRSVCIHFWIGSRRKILRTTSDLTFLVKHLDAHYALGKLVLNLYTVTVITFLAYNSLKQKRSSNPFTKCVQMHNIFVKYRLLDLPQNNLLKGHALFSFMHTYFWWLWLCYYSGWIFLGTLFSTRLCFQLFLIETIWLSKKSFTFYWKHENFSPKFWLCWS